MESKQKIEALKMQKKELYTRLLTGIILGIFFTFEGIRCFNNIFLLNKITDTNIICFLLNSFLAPAYMIKSITEIKQIHTIKKDITKEIINYNNGNCHLEANAIKNDDVLTVDFEKIAEENIIQMSFFEKRRIKKKLCKERCFKEENYKYKAGNTNQETNAQNYSKSKHL